MRTQKAREGPECNCGWKICLRRAASRLILRAVGLVTPVKPPRCFGVAAPPMAQSPPSSFRLGGGRIPRAGDSDRSSPDRGREAPAGISIVLPVRRAAGGPQIEIRAEVAAPRRPTNGSEGHATTEPFSEQAAAAPSPSSLAGARAAGRARPAPPLGRVGRSGETEARRRARGRERVAAE